MIPAYLKDVWNKFKIITQEKSNKIYGKSLESRLTEKNQIYEKKSGSQPTIKSSKIYGKTSRSQFMERAVRSMEEFKITVYEKTSEMEYKPPLWKKFKITAYVKFSEMEYSKPLLWKKSKISTYSKSSDIYGRNSSSHRT